MRQLRTRPLLNRAEGSGRNFCRHGPSSLSPLRMWSWCSTRLPSFVRVRKGFYLTKLFVGSCRGVPLVLAGPMLGAPQAVLVLEKMIALGVNEVIAAGWCGSLQPQVEIGHLVLPTGAFSEEGPPRITPLPLLGRDLRQSFGAAPGALCGREGRFTRGWYGAPTLLFGRPSARS